MFDDRKKFQVLNHNPTLTNLATVCNYIQRIYKCGKINEAEVKVQKYTDLPSFRPIIDTTNTLHHGVGKFLTHLLNPLTQNVHSVRICLKQ